MACWFGQARKNIAACDWVSGPRTIDPFTAQPEAPANDHHTRAGACGWAVNRMAQLAAMHGWAVYKGNLQ